MEPKFICIKNCKSYTGKKYSVGDTIDYRKYLDLTHSERQCFQKEITKRKIEGIESEHANEL